MPRLTLGILLGIVAGLASVAMMIPMNLPDKKRAMAGSFGGRFLIGFFAGTTTLPLPSAVSGLLIGLLVSVPDAIITRAYLPIILFGGVYGVLIGWAIGAWGV